MLNAILNGALGETSSRSGSSSSGRSGTSETTYSISTPTGTYTGLTLDQYNKCKYVLDRYNEAYGIAYSYDLPATEFYQFTASNAQSIVDDYAKRAIDSGKTSKAESWAAFAAERVAQQQATAVAAVENAMNVAIGAQYASLEERAAAIRAAVENAAKVVGTKVYYDEIAKGTNSEIAKREADRAEYAYYNEHYEPIRQAEIDVVNSTATINTQPETAQPTVTQQPTATQPPNVVIPENVVPSARVAPSEEKGNSLLVPSILFALGVIGAIALTSKSKKRR